MCPRAFGDVRLSRAAFDSTERASHTRAPLTHQQIINITIHARLVVVASEPTAC